MNPCHQLQSISPKAIHSFHLRTQINKCMINANQTVSSIMNNLGVSLYSLLEVTCFRICALVQPRARDIMMLPPYPTQQSALISRILRAACSVQTMQNLLKWLI